MIQKSTEEFVHILFQACYGRTISKTLKNKPCTYETLAKHKSVFDFIITISVVTDLSREKKFIDPRRRVPLPPTRVRCTTEEAPPPSKGVTTTGNDQSLYPFAAFSSTPYEQLQRSQLFNEWYPLHRTRWGSCTPTIWPQEEKKIKKKESWTVTGTPKQGNILNKCKKTNMIFTKRVTIRTFHKFVTIFKRVEKKQV